jgi:predicted N-acetyltransferase YhbS
MNDLVVREATEADVPATVTLLHNQWPTWSEEKYRYYYRHYPVLPTLSLVAVDASGAIVAHFGAVPVTVTAMPAGLVVHVVVRPGHRGGSALAAVISEAERLARARGMQFFCGFGNIQFSKVAERFFGWTIAGALAFAEAESFDAAPYRDRLRFEYELSWYAWKFGTDEDVYVRPYAKDGRTLHQLLKIRRRTRVHAADFGVPALSLWPPERYTQVGTAEWSQPFVVRPLTSEVPKAVLSLDRWYIEMGDSDTFEPHRPWAA